MNIIVVADTGPIRYLVSIREIDVLQRLFQRVFLPLLVANELRHPSAPSAVREWMGDLPTWVSVLPSQETSDPAFSELDAGERSALILALSLGADLILIDERKGAAAALKMGFEVTGTLGVLDFAAELGLIDLAEAFARLKSTNFRYRQDLLDTLLKKHCK